MLKPIIFWGASGQAKVLYEFIEIAGYKLIALFDNQKCPSPINGIPVYHSDKDFIEWNNKHSMKELFFLIAIGGSKGKDRIAIHNFLKQHKLFPATVTHPTAHVAENASIGDGSQILMMASIGVEVSIGENCIINSAANVDHECILGKGVHIAPRACLTGCIKVGDYSMIGAGAVILPRITIGKNVIVGAGSIVTKDIPNNCIVTGNPATPLKKR